MESLALPLPSHLLFPKLRSALLFWSYVHQTGLSAAFLPEMLFRSSLPSLHHILSATALPSIPAMNTLWKWRPLDLSHPDSWSCPDFCRYYEVLHWQIPSGSQNLFFPQVLLLHYRLPNLVRCPYISSDTPNFLKSCGSQVSSYLLLLWKTDWWYNRSQSYAPVFHLLLL